MAKYIAIYHVHCKQYSAKQTYSMLQDEKYIFTRECVHFSKIIHSVPKNVSTCLKFLYIRFW